MNREDLKNRTKKFTLDVIKTCDQLPEDTAFTIFSKQLMRCSSSIGANYRAACRAKSNADFINKLKIVEEETDEAIYFLELLKEINDKNTKMIDSLIDEANELLAIFVASIKTAKKRNRKS